MKNVVVGAFLFALLIIAFRDFEHAITSPFVFPLLLGLVAFVIVMLFSNDSRAPKDTKMSILAKEKCDFCNEAPQGPIKVITFSFTGETQHHCCAKCFNKASENDMRITSPKIVKDYIKKEHIEYANEPRLKNFLGSQIYIHGLWVTINDLMFFSGPEIGLPFDGERKEGNTPSSQNTANQGSDGSFWTSFIVADLTNSTAAGYLAGGSFSGALLGSSMSTSSSSSSSSWSGDSGSSSSWDSCSSDSSCSDSGSSGGGGD